MFTPCMRTPYEISLEQLAQSYFIGRRAERLRAEGKKVPGDAEAIATVGIGRGLCQPRHWQANHY